MIISNKYKEYFEIYLNKYNKKYNYFLKDYYFNFLLEYSHDLKYSGLKE
jgi:hypothetical protein